MMRFVAKFTLLFLLLTLSACQSDPLVQSNPPVPKLKVVATTTIVGDVVAQIGGVAIDLVVLLPVGTDPHSFQPTPQDMARVADAQVIFINGVGLETFLEPLLESSGSKAVQSSVSEGIAVLEASGADAHPPAESADNSEAHSGDPHVWMDPNNVLSWVDNIEKVLLELDEKNASVYRQNAARYRQALRDLDQWIVQQTAQIPLESRELVTDHQVFTYFATRYGFKQIGAVVPGYSTLAEPSAQELAELEDNIRKLGVRAVFVGNTVNPNLAQRVAQDTGVALVPLYTGSLTGADEPAANYLDYIRFNVNAIVTALK